MTIDPFALDKAPYGEPLSLTVGRSAQWRRAIDIDNSLYSLKYVLRLFDPTEDEIDYSIDMEFVSDGIYGADVAAADISDWTASRYYWDLVVVRTSDSAEKIVDSGEIYVWDGDSDRRSHAEIMIGKIESILQNRADNDVETYTIKSRSITKMSAAELVKWRDYYIREMENRPMAEGIFAVNKPKKDTVRVRFL